jgi:hypothetical protein
MALILSHIPFTRSRPLVPKFIRILEKCPDRVSNQGSIGYILVLCYHMCCVALMLIKVVIYLKTLVDTQNVGGVAHCLSKVVAELGPFIFELMFCKSYLLSLCAYVYCLPDLLVLC